MRVVAIALSLVLAILGMSASYLDRAWSKPSKRCDSPVSAVTVAMQNELNWALFFRCSHRARDVANVRRNLP